MKKIITIVSLMLSVNSFADTLNQLDKSQAPANNLPDCKMPFNLNDPKEGECDLRGQSFNAGSRIVKDGDTCYREEWMFVDLKQKDAKEKLKQAPGAQKKPQPVECPK